MVRGGYFACKETRYGRMHKIRQLSLWKGIEKGPKLPKLDTSDSIEFFHGAVSFKWNGSKTLKKYIPDGLEVRSLLSGGGHFIPAENEHEYKVLATYSDDNTYAAVKTKRKNGTDILMNPYVIYGEEHMSENLPVYEKCFPQHNWRHIVRELEGSALKRNICFVDMLLEASQKGE